MAGLLLDPHSPGDTIFNDDDTLVVLNKTDLVSHDLGNVCSSSGGGLKLCPLSCKTEEGVEEFLQQLKNILEKM